MPKIREYDETPSLDDADNFLVDKPAAPNGSRYHRITWGGIKELFNTQISQYVTSVAGRGGAVVLDVSDIGNAASDAELLSHTSRTDNPHEVTKAQVGLSEADNTSDADKPVSAAQQTALDLKADSSDLTAHTSDTTNPHSVTATQVGLGNVDNTSDANKPVSTATQTALDGKVSTTRQVATQHSLTGGGDLSANRTLSLVNDSAAPGNNKTYGTDGSGNRGWKDDPVSTPFIIVEGTGDGTTDDTTAVQDAVDAAVAAGEWLYWPEGTYLTTASIDDFHSVKHFGPGIVKRGSDLFYVSPREDSDTCRLYVSSSGADTNDGLSSAEPFETLQEAFDIVQREGLLRGTWEIILSASTLSEGGLLSRVTTAHSRLVIKGPARSADTGLVRIRMTPATITGGPFTDGETVTGGGATGTIDSIDNAAQLTVLMSGSHAFAVGDTITGGTSGASGTVVAVAPVPAAIIDGTSASLGAGIAGGLIRDLEIRDVLIQNFTNAGEKDGLDFNQTTVLLTNVHTHNCDEYGWYFKSNCIWTTDGGWVTGCARGIVELFSNVRSTTRDVNDPLVIADNTDYGMFSKELCTGHMDYAVIDNNVVNVFFARACTANFTGAKIWNGDYGVVLRGGSQVVKNNTDFALSTADKNTVPWLVDGNSGFVPNENGVWNSDFTGYSERTLRSLAPSAGYVLTGTTSATSLAAIAELPAGSLIKAGTYIRCVVIGRKTGTAGTATIDLRIGNSTGPSAVLTATMTLFRIEFWMVSRGAADQRVFSLGDGIVDDVTSAGNRTYATDTTDFALSLRGTLGSAADTLRIDMIQLFTTDIMPLDQDSY